MGAPPSVAGCTIGFADVASHTTWTMNVASPFQAEASRHPDPTAGAPQIAFNVLYSIQYWSLLPPHGIPSGERMQFVQIHGSYKYPRQYLSLGKSASMRCLKRRGQ